MINTTVGKYVITKLIGEGGMASVYEAEHEMLGTKVAIKVLNPILSANELIRERFKNEAKLMASLDHPNITKVIDFDDQPQQLSIIMEFLQGEDLDDKIKRSGPLSEKEITDIFTQSLSAFQYAHEKGIVHRDIKPSNIFLLPNGNVKILDFGIAKLFGQGTEMTQTGTQMGTPIYMSPEQVKADKTIDHRSDIYSLGVTMFFAINGKPPYNPKTDSQFDIFNRIVFEKLPDFTCQSNYKALVDKACNKDREDRFQSCQEWLVAMKEGITEPVVENRRPTKETSDSEKTIIASANENTTEFEKRNVSGERHLKKEPPINPQPQHQPNKKNRILLISLLALVGLVILGYVLTNSQNDVNQDLLVEEQSADSTSGVENYTTKVDSGAVAVDTMSANGPLSGRHKLSLQWISWTYFGYIDFVNTGANEYKVSGYQDGNASQGECDNCYLKINGTITQISENVLSFNGRIESSVNSIQNGVPCVKQGRFTFKSTQGRKYWRLQEMDGCDGVTDYVDIYF